MRLNHTGLYICGIALYIFGFCEHEASFRAAGMVLFAIGIAFKNKGDI